MKKYIVIFPIFIISFIVISFYIFRNAEITKTIEKFTEIQKISYELEIVAQKQKMLFLGLFAEISYDEIANNNKQFQEALLYYSKIIKLTNDTKLKKILKNIKSKNDILLHIYPFDTINTNDKQKSLLLLEEKLNENNLIIEFDKVVLHTLKKINALQTETALIIKILLISIVFLTFFGLTVYIREILASLETKKLKNDLQQFVDALNESAIVSKTDLKGIISYVNEKFCTVSEYSVQELIGNSHNVIRHRDVPTDTFTNLWATIQDKKVFKAIIKNRTKSGGFYYVDTMIMPILDIHGKIKEYLAVRYDVTELIISRDKAIVAEKAKGEFLSNISHELRTPLNAINGFSSILVRLIKDEKQLSYVKHIIDSSQNLIGLINDILDLSKFQSGKFHLDYHDFNVKENIDFFLDKYIVLVDKSDLTMEINLDKSIDTVLYGDWLRISQILTNLISNAIKFTPQDKKIYFIANYIDGKLFLEIRDEGIGMSQKAQNKIFKPFEQADSSTTRKYGGTGLGLSIVLNLIEQMNGKIKLDSKEGVGSSFKITIPLKECKIEEIENNISQEEDDTLEPLNGHILIAEDNKTNQMLLGILMEEFGLSFSIANDGKEAVEIFGKEEFDLVLMDENMPNLNGSEAMKKIHELYSKNIPIVAITANAISGDKEKFLASGKDGYIAKPINDKELHKEMKRLLKK